MVGMLAFTNNQPIVGVDIHISLPPIPTAPLPHAVVWFTGTSLNMGLPMALTSSHALAPNHPAYLTKPVAVGAAYACGRGHDAGAHLGHIAGNTLLAIIWLGASSKAEFASGTVIACGEHMAVNMMMVANMQLQCGDPVPLPSGLSLATSSSMVFVNFTFTDLLNGLAHMLEDILLAALINLFLGALVGAAGKLWAKAGLKSVLSEVASDLKASGTLSFSAPLATDQVPLG